MDLHESPLVEAAKRLTAALVQETRLARSGALGELETASSAKRDAFRIFERVCADRDPQLPQGEAERSAMRDLVQAAEESALVLEAVQSTLGDFAASLRNVVISMADPGTYHPVQAAPRHVGALHLNAEI